jgi:hypothetical protein
MIARKGGGYFFFTALVFGVESFARSTASELRSIEYNTAVTLADYLAAN